MLESDIKAIRNFIYVLLFIIGFFTMIGLYVMATTSYQGCSWKYQPEVSWYSGPIGNDCGCK